MISGRLIPCGPAPIHGADYAHLEKVETTGWMAAPVGLVDGHLRWNVMVGVIRWKVKLVLVACISNLLATISYRIRPDWPVLAPRIGPY